MAPQPLRTGFVPARLLRPTSMPLLVTALICTGVSSSGNAQTLPTGFALQSVVTDPFASDPVAFAFLPDARILILEKDTGNVRLAAVGGSTSALIATVAGVRGGGERGLLGVAVDPAWPARPYLYFQDTHTDSTVHITMYTASGDLSNPASTNLVLGSPYLVHKAIRDVVENHNGGTLRFGPDGYLYVSAGDDGNGCNSQDVNHPNGKILRLDVSRMPGTGSGPPPLADITPPDNPIPGPTDTAHPGGFDRLEPSHRTQV